MKKFSLAALAALCSIAAHTNAASSETNQLYIESSIGLQDYSISNYKSPTEANYNTGRWMDYNHGTDLNLNVGYYVREDIRLSFGYKRSKQMMLNFFNGSSNNSNLNVVQQIDAYVLNFYKDFPITNTSWTPYIGAGVGIANVSSDASGSSTGALSSASGSVYRQLIAGLSYSLKNFDLFSELSYGGVGESTWRTASEGDINFEKTMNLTGSFGVRYRF